jgi:hypothetical protein
MRAALRRELTLGLLLTLGQRGPTTCHNQQQQLQLETMEILYREDRPPAIISSSWSTLVYQPNDLVQSGPTTSHNQEQQLETMEDEATSRSLVYQPYVPIFLVVTPV